MKEISIEELKDMQIDMLEKIHMFCIKNGIHYFISYGSLIGAIRHKGYIPWDDDIDISMPRPDFEKFVHTFNGEYPELEVLAPEINWNFFEPYANVYDKRTILLEDNNPHNGVDIGVKIDIFPIDGVPSNISDYYKHRKKIRKLNLLRGYKKETIWKQLYTLIKKRRGFRSFLRRIQHPFISYVKIQKKMHKLALKYDYSTSTYVESIVFQPKFYTQKERQFYEDYIDVQFERLTLKAPKNYDAYLKTIYGDYMQLPPIEERVYHHGFKAYWKD